MKENNKELSIKYKKSIDHIRVVDTTTIDYLALGLLRRRNYLRGVVSGIKEPIAETTIEECEEELEYVEQAIALIKQRVKYGI